MRALKHASISIFTFFFRFAIDQKKRPEPRNTKIKLAKIFV